MLTLRRRRLIIWRRARGSLRVYNAFGAASRSWRAPGLR